MKRYISLADRTEVLVRDEGTGPVVMLVHGFPLDGSMWEAQQAALARQYRVLVPDLRGFGESALGDLRLLTMGRLADDLAQVLDACDITSPIALGGLSMGGYIVWEFWQRYSDRLSGLMLINTRAEADSPEVARGREMTARRVLEEGVLNFSEEMLQRLFAPETRQRAAAVVEHWHRVVNRQSPQAVAAALMGMARRVDMRDVLPTIVVPSLVIAGEHDKVTPADQMRAMADRLPHAQLEVIAQAGHLTPIEQPERVTRLMSDFLAQWRLHHHPRE